MTVESVWLADIDMPPTGGVARPPVFGMMSTEAPGGFTAKLSTAESAAMIRVSDRGWIGEPGDTEKPNVAYLPRLVEPPAIERSIPIYPSDGTRRSFDAAELALINTDGALDALTEALTVVGRTVTIRRGAHTRPLHADRSGFPVILKLRAGGPFQGSPGRLSLPLLSAATDLTTIDACGTYGGTGGADGDSTLAGQYRPRLFGSKKNIVPTLVNASLLIYQLNAGPISAVTAVRDLGVALTASTPHSSYANLAAATLTASTYRTSLSDGFIRLGSPATLLTVDASGDATTELGGWVFDPAQIASRLLSVAAGFPVGTTTSADFDWPTGEAGLYLTGGSVADALDQLAAGVLGAWGPDNTGRIKGTATYAPEGATPAATIQPYHLASPPEDVGAVSPPWWYARADFARLGRTQSGAELAGSVAEFNRWFYGQESAWVTATDTGIRDAYPSAVQGRISTIFHTAPSAQTLANRALALYGVPRRRWLLRLGPAGMDVLWPALTPGAAVSLTWPWIPALASGKMVVLQSLSARGDAAEAVVWG